MVEDIFMPKPDLPRLGPDDASVSLLPLFQSYPLGSNGTIQVNLGDQLLDVEGVHIKVSYDENFITPVGVVKNPSILTATFLHSTIYPADSIVADFGFLEGSFDAPGDVMWIVFTADSVTNGTDLVIETAIVRDSDNQDYSLTTNNATVKIADYVCGDANADGYVDIDDAVYVIAFIFTGGPSPLPYASGNCDCSIDVDIDDVVYLIAFIFTGGPAPCDMDDNGIPDC